MSASSFSGMQTETEWLTDEGAKKKIKSLSGSCHTWDLVYMKVLLKKLLEY